MNQPDLFDIVELLVDLPEYNLEMSSQGTIVECYDGNNYEVEFANKEGETVALCVLSPKQFIIVWQAKTKSWLSVSERINSIVKTLDKQEQQEVFKFVLSLQK